jgi:hypothetical protein
MDRDWGGRPVYYDRGGTPMTLQQWAKMLEDESYRHVARDVIGPEEPLDPAPLITVSTCWGGLNHDWRSGEPLIYQTVIVGGDYDATGVWYATENQARDGHRRIVGELRAGRSPHGLTPLTPPAHPQITAATEREVSRSWIGTDHQQFPAEQGRHRRVKSSD